MKHLSLPIALLKLFAIAALATIVLWPAVSPAQTNVTTFHNDNFRSGANLNETVLTPANISAQSSFGKLFEVGVDGPIDAQVLYVSALAIKGNSLANVAFAVTERDSVYAFDADTFTPYWHVSVLLAGETTTTTKNGSSSDTGISSTPVIDLTAGAHGTIYLVASSIDAFGVHHQRLHALDITTGAEQSNGPIEIQATYPRHNSYDLVFDPSYSSEQAGLLLQDGMVYTNWTDGWEIGYDRLTLQQTSVFLFSPDYYGGAIVAGAPAADAEGNQYVSLGYGAFDYQSLNAEGFPNPPDYGSSFVKLSVQGAKPSPTDFFLPYNASDGPSPNRFTSGWVQGVNGIILLPDVTDANGRTRHLAVGGDEGGNLYVVDRDNMGKYDASPPNGNLYQELSGALSQNLGGTFTYFNGNLYIGPGGSPVRMFTLNKGRLSAGAAFTDPYLSDCSRENHPILSPVVSANATENGVVWFSTTYETYLCGEATQLLGRLFALDASNLQLLYQSDSSGPGVFAPLSGAASPTVANGKVFVPTINSVAIFGLLNQPVPPVVDGLYLLVNAQSNLLLDDPASSVVSGTQIDGWPENGGINQSWRFAYQGNGAYTIQNVSSGLFLTDPNGSNILGTALEQQIATGNSLQEWSLTPTALGYVLQNRASGLVIDDPRGSDKPGIGIIMYVADGGPNQTWILQSLSAKPLPDVDEGDYFLTNSASNLNLDIPGNSTTPGTQIIQSVQSNALSQTWHFHSLSNYVFTSAYFTVQNRFSGLFLTDPNGSGKPATPLEQQPATNDGTQLWSFTYGGSALTIRNQASGLVIDDPRASIIAGTGIIVWPKNGRVNQNWVLSRVPLTY